MTNPLRSFVAAAVVGIVATAHPGAQTKPDFSGRWVLGAEPAPTPGAANPQPGRQGGRGPRSGDMGSGWGSQFTIVHTANEMSVETAYFTRGDLQPQLTFVFSLDGKETSHQPRMGRGAPRQTSTASWDGDALVVVTKHAAFDPVTGKAGQGEGVEVRQRLTLESPTTLVVETTRSGVMGGKPSTVRSTYQKQ